jgi:hypothetical protein
MDGQTKSEASRVSHLFHQLTRSGIALRAVRVVLGTRRRSRLEPLIDNLEVNVVVFMALGRFLSAIWRNVTS